METQRRCRWSDRGAKEPTRQADLQGQVLQPAVPELQLGGGCVCHRHRQESHPELGTEPKVHPGGGVLVPLRPVLGAPPLVVLDVGLRLGA